MTETMIFSALVILSVLGFITAKRRSLNVAGGNISELHSLPRHYGYLASLRTILPGLLILVLWLLLGSAVIESMILSALPQSLFLETGTNAQALLLNKIRLVVEHGNKFGDNPDILEAATHYSSLYNKGLWGTFSLSISIALIGMFTAIYRIKPDFRARSKVERIMLLALILSSVIATLTTMGIIGSLIFESVRFFQQIPLLDFVTGLKWSPQTALRADQVAASGSFGAVPLFVGTLLISFLAMMVAGPVGLFSAIYLTKYASKKVRSIVKPLLEILAGVPTIVYGFFAAITVAPFLRDTGTIIGLDIASESALTSGFVMGIMIIPFVSSLSDDAITAVPKSLDDASLALGATKSGTIKQVILPAALPGITGAFLLAISRAVGETMIVVMAAGMKANLTVNPFESVTTVTVQIVALLTGDQEFDSAKTLSAFALGLMLFITTLALNIVALSVVRKYREAYE